MAEFAAGAGHEMNNPLAVISGRAQLLLRDETAPQRRNELALIHAQAIRVHEMIADMRLYATAPRPERHSVELVELVRRATDELRAAAIEQETELVFAPSTDTLPILADPVQVAVAVKAIVQNALEALAQGGRIEVSLDGSGEEATITIADNGPGILPEERPHIFEPFYAARQAGRGLGMGLSKAWRIVTNHGGRIEVASTSSCGATFVIRLARTE